MYFNYHAKAKKLIAEGHLIRYEFAENWGAIRPALVLPRPELFGAGRFIKSFGTCFFVKTVLNPLKFSHASRVQSEFYKKSFRRFP